MTVLEQISHETMIFMRSQYCLDEIGDGRSILKFMQGRRTILTIYIRDEKFTFLLVFGKRECEYFEMLKSEFPREIQECYENAKARDNGKWLYVDVNTLEQLEEVKKLIFVKKKPNRNLLSKRNKMDSQRCQSGERGVHYLHTDEELSKAMKSSMIHTEIHFADEIAWGILPYVPLQYGEQS